MPPGYATLIWPPSGIALGFLLFYGYRVVPGVLLGSFLLNAGIAGAFGTAEGLQLAKLAAALGIACGSTLQAMAGRYAIAKSFGLPLALRNLGELLRLFLIMRAPALHHRGQFRHFQPGGDGANALARRRGATG